MQQQQQYQQTAICEAVRSSVRACGVCESVWQKVERARENPRTQFDDVFK